MDRLTRSLTDFSKLVEVFDKREVSFVSVTQAFNTTNSMGDDIRMEAAAMINRDFHSPNLAITAKQQLNVTRPWRASIPRINEYILI